MLSLSSVFMTLQVTCTIVALFLNSFLIFIIHRFTKSNIGFYKYILIAFACFEMTYALIVLVGMPINFIADQSWIVFNHDGIIGKTALNWLGPTLYCSFYELWMGFVVVHFIYRYVAVCKLNWKEEIAEKNYLKVIIVFIYMIQFTYCFICGVFFCTRSVISKDLQKIIKRDFDVADPQGIGYILLRVRTLEGNLSPGGIISIVNHYVIVSISICIICFCGYNIWRSIGVMQKESSHLREVNLQKQMFYTLVIQTLIPLFLCHLPSLVYLTFPFWDKSFTFGTISPVFSFLTTVPKVLDPIVVIICIREYRKAASYLLCIFRERSSVDSLTAFTLSGNETSHGADRRISMPVPKIVPRGEKKHSLPPIRHVPIR